MNWFYRIRCPRFSATILRPRPTARVGTDEFDRAVIDIRRALARKWLRQNGITEVRGMNT